MFVPCFVVYVHHPKRGWLYYVLSSWCSCDCYCSVTRVGLQFVIVVFPYHTCLLGLVMKKVMIEH